MTDLRKILVDGLQVETTDAGIAAIEKLQSKIADMAEKMTAAEAKAKKEKDDLEAEMAKKDAALAKADAEKLTDAALDARVAARADLIGKVKLIAKDVATAGLSDAAIRKAVVVAKLGDAALAGKSDAYVDARFDILADEAEAADPIKDAKPKAQNVTDISKAYDARDAALINAWKTPAKEA
jgi:hypothetical protein